MADHVDVILDDWRRERPDRPLTSGNPRTYYPCVQSGAPEVGGAVAESELTPASFDAARTCGAPARPSGEPLRVGQFVDADFGSPHRTARQARTPRPDRAVAGARDRRVTYAPLTDNGLRLIGPPVRGRRERRRDASSVAAPEALLGFAGHRQPGRLLSCVQVRLMRNVGRAAVAAGRRRCREGRRRARRSGEVEMGTDAVKPAACSNTVALMPRRVRAMAVGSPPTPPTMATPFSAPVFWECGSGVGAVGGQRRPRQRGGVEAPVEALLLLVLADPGESLLPSETGLLRSAERG